MIRRMDGVLATLLLAALATGAYVLKGEPVRMEGQARVVDGDTLDFGGGRRLRIAGIDAPELRQTCERGGRAYSCGEAARDALRDLVRAGVVCRVAGRDRYDRDLGTCEAAGQDVGAALVGLGMAVAFGRYEAEERDARDRVAGIWAGRFQRPSEWREARRL